MADPILHIKDSYYFEVPKFLWPSHYDGLTGEKPFPDFWVRLDLQYLEWEAQQVHEALRGELNGAIPEWNGLRTEYGHWLHEGHNAGKPFAEFVRDQDWFQKFAAESDAHAKLENIQQTVRGQLSEYRTKAEPWSDEKVDGYNKVLSGHILVPQPFGGELKNLYEPASGFCLSKFMIVEVVVALLLGWFFIGLAQRIRDGKTPKGGFWNFLEAILVFMRDDVARPAIGGHDADKFVPVLWTIFLFILGCNLMGMIPWVGTPTGAFGTTIALAAVTLLTGIVSGSKKFGVVGYWANQVPHMDLPAVMKIILVPVIWLLEVVGMFVRHGVLAVRLLANMVAGHLVLLSIMMLAFSISGAASSAWWITAPVVVVGSTLFSCLELFVAFLQAYIFTFLSALFIGAAVHHH
ncbi:MAG: F0F1 ATP synthase subunit A [Planctomycetota bacterium]|nr:F0F1 ATP synthase subunit A [Planctomycetota bacterium]MDA1180278.1 F0F1 ATP synthase subunit A [Planctomycetota bacterium]